MAAVLDPSQSLLAMPFSSPVNQSDQLAELVRNQLRAELQPFMELMLKLQRANENVWSTKVSVSE